MDHRNPKIEPVFWPVYVDRVRVGTVKASDPAEARRQAERMAEAYRRWLLAQYDVPSLQLTA